VGRCRAERLVMAGRGVGRGGGSDGARRKAPAGDKGGAESSGSVDRAGKQRQRLKQLGGAADATVQRKSDHTTLLKALVREKVASSETCVTLIKGGLVKVNGVAQQDPYLNVRLSADEIIVAGTPLKFSSEDNADAQEPKGVRDFGGGRMQELKEKVGDSYNWRVDGGFYASKRGLRGTS